MLGSFKGLVLFCRLGLANGLKWRARPLWPFPKGLATEQRLPGDKKEFAYAFNPICPFHLMLYISHLIFVSLLNGSSLSFSREVGYIRHCNLSLLLSILWSPLMNSSLLLLIAPPQ
jgi:hypothetical protein